MCHTHSIRPASLMLWHLAWQQLFNKSYWQLWHTSHTYHQRMPYPSAVAPPTVPRIPHPKHSSDDGAGWISKVVSLWRLRSVAECDLGLGYFEVLYSGCRRFISQAGRANIQARYSYFVLVSTMILYGISYV